MMIQNDDRNLERFLLDELHPSEREEFEQRLFVDDELFSRVEELETDLVDAFVRSDLDADQRERFERSLELNPARQEKVRFAKLFLQNLDGSKNTNVVPFTRRYSSVLTAALAAALLVIVIGVPTLMRKASSPAVVPQATSTEVDRVEVADHDTQTTLPPGTATDSAETVEAPTVAIKRPPVPSVAVDPSAALESVSFVLSTVNLRSGTGLSTLEIRGSVELVVIQLGIETDEFPGYNVDIRNSSGNSVWNARRLSLTTIEGAPAVSFEVPASVLEDGRHELVLAGVSAGGTEEIAYVDFAVKRLP